MLGSPEASLEAEAKKDGPAAAALDGQKTLDRLAALVQAIEAAPDFAAPAIRAEMLSAVEASRQRVGAALRAIAGQSGDAEKKKAVEAEYRAMLKNFVKFEATQGELFERIKSLHKPGYYANAEKELNLRELEDLHAVWWRDWKVAVEKGKQCGAPRQRCSR